MCEFSFRPNDLRGSEGVMGLKIMILAGLALVLIVGSCIVGVVTGDTDMEDGTPFTVNPDIFMYADR